MTRRPLSHAASLLCLSLLPLGAHAQQPTTTAQDVQQRQAVTRGAETFQGLRRVYVPPVPLDPQFYVVAQFCDQYGPAVRLANNKVYRLERTTNSCPGNTIRPPATIPGEPTINAPAPKPRADLMHWLGSLNGLASSPAHAQALPPSVSLAAQQTSIKNQVRNTCTYYSTIAALEAAYKRNYGMDLDLSERHLNHRLHMSLLKSTLDLGQATANVIALPKAEVESGAWDGGQVATNLRFMVDQAVGVPLESTHPEVLANDNFSIRNAGDNPDVEDWTLIDQRTMDDFNLGDTILRMKIPDSLELIPLPEAALLTARYRPTSIVLASSDQMTSLDWYRSQLAAGHEVIIQFWCCDGFNLKTDVIHNVQGSAAHAALLIGYDDGAQEFQLKNSWGENTYRRFAYDNITGGSVMTAGVILDVASPLGRFSVRDNSQAFIGRWLLTDGEFGQTAGTLDIYLSPINPGTKRIGAFFSPGGAIYRVNGSADNGTLRFFIDVTQPNLPGSVLNVGHQYTAYLFDHDRTMMVGDATLLSNGTVRGFVARKTQALPTTPTASRNNLLDPKRILLGDWRIELETEIGHLLLNNFNESTGNFEGTYNPENQSPYGGYASLQGDSFVAWTDAPTADAFRLFAGHFADDQMRVVAGYGNGNGSVYGSGVGQPFVGVLTNEQPVITIPAVSGTLGPPGK
jgi:hypothetical protein